MLKKSYFMEPVVQVVSIGTPCDAREERVSTKKPKVVKKSAELLHIASDESFFSCSNRNPFRAKNPASIDHPYIIRAFLVLVSMYIRLVGNAPSGNNANGFYFKQTIENTIDKKMNFTNSLFSI